MTDNNLDHLASNVEIKAIYLGRRESEPGSWEHDTWSVSLTYEGRTYQDIAFKMGIGNSPQPKPIVTIYDQEQAAKFYRTPEQGGTWKPTNPTVADVIYSLMMDSTGLDQSFESWASDLGYDTDSRKAEAIHHQCLETLPKLHALLGSDFSEFEIAAHNY